MSIPRHASVGTAALLLAFSASCGTDLETQGRSLVNELSDDGQTHEREIPGADPDFTVGGDGRPIPAGGGTDSGQPDPEAAPEAENEAENEADPLPPRDEALILNRLVVPEGVDAQTHVLGADAWIFDAPNADCSDTTGVHVPANGYVLSNPEGAAVDVRLGLRTASNGVSLSLENGAIYVYTAGLLPDFSQSCTVAGVVSDSFASEAAGITVPAGGSIEFLVAGLGPADIGSYQITVIRESAETPVAGGEDDGPVPTPPSPDPGSGTDPPAGDGLCANSCSFAGDGTCDDGGPGADFSVCELGTDCDDCGPRAPDESGGMTPPAPETLCMDTCGYSFDGDCDDGGAGSDYSICDLGTDCGDCGPRASGGSLPPSALCTDTCSFAADGDCDDGGTGSDFSFCEFGTDCSDCGPR